MSEEYRNNEEQSNGLQNSTPSSEQNEMQNSEVQNNENAQNVNFVMQGSVQRENESDITSSENVQEAQTTETSSAAQETAAAYEPQFSAAEEKHSSEKKAKNKKKGGWKKGVAVAAAVVIGVGAVGTGGYYGAQSLKTSMRNWISQEVASLQSSQTAKTATLSQSDSSSTTNTTGSTGATLLDVSDVVKNIKPSVVAVTNELLYTANYFGRTASQTSPASGSGVIIGENDEEFLIVTNYHVVSGEDSSSSQMYTVTSENISVQFIDGTSADTTLKGTDEAADLAVLAVKKSDLSDDTMKQIKIATIGDSSALNEGEGVIAIGNALGYGLSATVGYVSALDRELTVNNNTNTYIQTDAAINPGNSGGGLFNTAGELIGINDAKTVDENVEGMGYAIPISNVGDIITNLMNEEPRTQVSDDEKGYLGISGQDIDASMSKVYGMPEGVLVAYVQEGSAAEQAGLQKHDIICAIDGTEVSSFEKLREEIGYYAAGEQAELTVERLENGQYTEKKITVTFGSYAEEAPEGGTIPADEANGN